MTLLPAAFDLTGKTALVTGAAGLLGRQHCLALAAIGAGVVVTDFSRDSLDRFRDECGRAGMENLDFRVMDVASTESIERVRDELRAAGKKIDILVNNAAIDPKVKADASPELENSRLENFDLAEWNRQIDVGLTGAFLCSRTFGADMAERGKGVILNIASDLAVIAPDQRIYRKEGLPEARQPVKPVTYSVIKAGLVGLTRYLATYWADRGVRANALSPGGVFQNQSEEFVRKLTSLIPMGRMAALDEYRAAVQFMCSDASAYLNGQNIVMDGGRSVL
jgi:NAD(P)-dependent dehydrogenase (short-subunit alcohol dehydrogenase family)